MLRLRVPALLLLLATPALADRLDASVVDARARVLIHLDVEALKATTLFGLARAGAAEEIDAALADFAAETGLNPLEDVRGATVYALDVSDGRWIALLHTNARLDAALEQLRKQPGYSESQVGDKTILALTNGSERWYGHLFRAKGGEQRLFALSESSEALVEAIGVVDGARPSLGEGAEPLVASTPSAGAVLFVSAATDLSALAGLTPSAEVSRLVRGVLFECGETDGTFFSLVRLSTGTHDDAEKVHQVIQGGLALASLIAGRSEETRALGELADALEVERTGTVVTLVFRYASRELYQRVSGALEAQGD
jgi:hypothetical protein